MSSSVGIYGALTDTHTTEVNTLGMRFRKGNGDEYVFVKAGAAIAQYDAVRFSGSASGYDDVRPTSAINQVVLGAAQVAIASGSYGWILEHGVGTAKVVAATAAGSSLGSTATAGTLGLVDATVFGNVGKAVALVTGVAAGSAVRLG